MNRKEDRSMAKAFGEKFQSFKLKYDEREGYKKKK